MAKSPFEKQIESQMRQAKQLADKQRREADKRAREQKRMEQKAAVREQALALQIRRLVQFTHFEELLVLR